jgi:DNA-binding IclR family transcriptional regulator
MTLIDQIKRIERLDFLIRTRATGTPAELARKLGMSQSQTFQLLKLIKEEMEAPVVYSKTDQSYCYIRDVKFTFGFRSDN